MNAPQIIKTLEQWQLDSMNKTRGVFVYHFNLQPQAKGFMLDLELHEDGVSDPENGNPNYYVYALSLSELFDKATRLIEDRKAILREALNS